MKRIMLGSLLAAALLVTVGAIPQQGGLYLPAGSAISSPTLKGIDGVAYDLKALSEKGPVFLTFWKDPCPHNRRAMPFFNALKEAYGAKATMLGAVRSSDDGTKAWSAQFAAKFPLMPDPDSQLINAFKSAYSICTFEIVKGKITRVFEGYGQNELKALNAALAEAAGTAPAQIDLSAAPTRQTWG
jgi:thiol-disulfide isomerase/thioredoxin